jgi:hypothetical protein
MDNNGLELKHYGVKGMKWGVRRYQNKDGSLTYLGKKHQQRALNTIRKGKELAEHYKNTAGAKFETAKRENKGTVNSTQEEKTAKDFVNAYKNLKAYELLEKAYKNGSIEVGRDYITDRAGNIKLSESGIVKEQGFKDKAAALSNKNNKGIIDKYIDGPERERNRITRSFELGDKYGKEIRNTVNKNTYASKSDKKKAIDKAFSKKLDEVRKTGDIGLYDSVWQQWQFALDELD